MHSALLEASATGLGAVLSYGIDGHGNMTGHSESQRHLYFSADLKFMQV